MQKETVTWNSDAGIPGGKDWPKFKLESIVQNPNLAADISRTVLDNIGRAAVEGYMTDRASRSEWEQRNEKAIKLALQVVEHKNFPWENCSNVKFPILTVAALQFLARVSVLTKGRKLAKVDFTGGDKDGKKYARAQRISKHLSSQLVDEDKNWIDSDEQAKLAASILGSAFKKTYHDQVTGVTHSEHVPVMDFVVDYYCKDIDKAHRITHVLGMDQNALQERVRQGLFLELDAGGDGQVRETNLLREAADDAQGVRRPATAEGGPEEILEQHTWLDFDGDGYAEPYILFVHLGTGQVLRIVARFYDQGDVYRVNDGAVRLLEGKLKELQNPEVPEGSPEGAAPPQPDLAEVSKLEKRIHELETSKTNHIIRIQPTLHFTRYLFIPSPDGGVYGLGLGSLLSPMNESVNTLINQLIDGGTMANTAGGFLGRGVKVKGGKMAFDPFEWKPIDSTGDDLRKNIFPLPVREPSAVLFQLLGMLVTYSEKISGATDIMTGVSPGQNTPAETSRNTVEQGMMLFSGIYNRMYRSFKSELEKFYEFNKLFFQYSPQFQDLVYGPNAILAKDDYQGSGFRIVPAASPEAVSTSQRRDKAAMLHQLASTEPGFNRYLVTRDLLEAWDFDNIEAYYPDPKGPNALPPPVNPKVELEKAKLQQAAQEHQDAMQLAVAELKNDIALNEAKIAELQAKATKYLAEAEGVDTGQQIAMVNAQIGAAKAHNEGLMKAAEVLQKQLKAQAEVRAMEAAGSQPQPGAGAKAKSNTGNERPMQ